MARFEVSILLCEEFSNMVLACLVEPLRVVRNHAGEDVCWTIYTHTDQGVTSSSGIHVVPDASLAESKRADLAIVVGGDAFREVSEQARERQSLPKVMGAERVIAADTGAWVLARNGYLEGRRSTLHWQLLDEFAESFPTVEVLPGPVVRDGRIWSCGSASAALEVMLSLIEERFGPVAAHEAGSMFLQDDTRHAQRARMPLSMALNASAALKKALEVMSENIEEPISIPDVAGASNLSERSLHRVFREELKTTPGRYYLMIRLARAKELARYSTLKSLEIALRCGFPDGAALSRSFRRLYGESFQKLRGERSRE